MLATTWKNMQKLLHEAFEAQACKRQDAVAVNLAGNAFSYRELNERSNQLAARLRSLGVRPEVPVALYLDRSPEMVVAILGVLKAGAATSQLTSRIQWIEWLSCSRTRPRQQF